MQANARLSRVFWAAGYGPWEGPLTCVGLYAPKHSFLATNSPGVATQWFASDPRCQRSFPSLRMCSVLQIADSRLMRAPSLGSGNIFSGWQRAARGTTTDEGFYSRSLLHPHSETFASKSLLSHPGSRFSIFCSSIPWRGAVGAPSLLTRRLFARRLPCQMLGCGSCWKTAAPWAFMAKGSAGRWPNGRWIE